MSANTEEEAPENPFLKYRAIVEEVDTTVSTGRVQEVQGLSILTKGPSDASIGDLVQVQTSRSNSDFVHCEVVGFRGHHLVLMPLGSPLGVFPEAQVMTHGKKLSIALSNNILGRILSGTGAPLDRGPPLISQEKRLMDTNPPCPRKEQ